ncbi:UvrD-helicase domain-containing protein [Hyella patelloides]|uniref:UvrD-helicase domain-containing protein n=1 Tax=Hyella patelloides TaxID=1982969 RepID=UPI001FE6DF7C
MVNECQDLNLCQIELSRKLVGKDGRLLYVGDPKQAIFGFAGAKCNSYDSRFA